MGPYHSHFDCTFEAIRLGRCRHRLFCRAEVNGCHYPGEALLDPAAEKGHKVTCRAITKTFVTGSLRPSVQDFQFLYNPEGASRLTWRHWPDGTDDLNFPSGVVKSDEKCNLMVARYNDRSDNALVDEDGYVYYQDANAEGQYDAWYWDNNEYDLLVERGVKKIEVLNLTYGEAIETQKRYDGHDISQSTAIFKNSKYKGNSSQEAMLSMSYTNSKSWSHSFQVAVTLGVQVEVTSPGKALLGGAKATYGFETSVSYGRGWGGGDSKTRQASVSVTEEVPPRSEIKVSIYMTQTTTDVPYTATYKVTYDDGSTRTVEDKGVMNNVFYSDAKQEVQGPFPID